MPSTARPSHLGGRASGTWPDKEKIGVWRRDRNLVGDNERWAPHDLRGRSVRSTDLTSVASTFSLSSSKFGIDFEEGEFRWRRDPRMALPWLPCSQRRPLVARISPKPARCGFPTLLAGPRLPCGAPRGRCASPDRHVCRRWRTLRCTLRRHPRPHTRCTDCPWAKAVCGSLVRRARRRQRRGVAARAASALPTHGSAGGRHCRRLCASRGRSSPDRLPGGGGGERSRVCAAGPLSRATARLPPPPPPRVRAALGSLLQPHRRGRRVRRSRQGACPKGESLLTRRARFAAAPPPSHAAAAAVSPHATCRRESPAADYSAETWRSAVRPAAVAAARSSCPGARRVDPATPPAVGGARSARPCRRVLPIAPRPSPRRLPLPRRQLGERRWRSLRRTPWLHARPVGVPEAMCG